MAVTFSVLALILFATALSSRVLNSKKEKLDTLVDTCQQAESAENMQEAVKELQDYWENNEWKIIAFVHHDQVEEVSLGIKRLESLSTDNSHELYLAECLAIKESLSHLTKGDRLSFHIFI